MGPIALYELRRRAAIARVEIAHLLNVSDQIVHKIESGEKEISDQDAEKIINYVEARLLNQMLKIQSAIKYLNEVRDAQNSRKDD